MTTLIELVYEGGELLDHALATQREILRNELGDGFLSVDLRRRPALERKTLLQTVMLRRTFKNVLIRGLSGLPEASQYFTTAGLFLDALGKSELPASRELSQWAFRTKRVFAYSDLMEEKVRAAGIGSISRHRGPYLPMMDFGTEDVSDCIGVLSLGRGAVVVAGQLRKRRDEEGLAYEVVTTERVAGTLQASSSLEVAERCGLLVAPYEEIDNGGPHEAALLALSTGRVLCTTSTSALHSLPISGRRLLRAACYEKGAYTEAAMRYEGIDAYAGDMQTGPLDAESVPNEVLRRI